MDRPTLTARLPADGLIAFAVPSPAALQRGVTLTLQPAVRVTGRLTSPTVPDVGWTNVHLQAVNRRPLWFAGYADLTGRFEFVAPPGEFQMECYGERVRRKYVPLTVPADKRELDLGAVELTGTHWGELVGKPAPPLQQVVGWAGDPTPLDALNGNVVLLHLWSHDIKQTAEALPHLAELATKHAADGLRVVAVHVSRSGDEVTADQFAAATAKLRGGKPLPFPVALTVGDRGLSRPDDGLTAGSVSRPAADYGWDNMTVGNTVVIDRAGVVKGLAYLSNADERARVAGLLK